MKMSLKQELAIFTLGHFSFPQHTKHVLLYHCTFTAGSYISIEVCFLS